MTIALPLGLNMVFVTMLLLFLVVFRKLIVRVILALLVLALAAATLAPAGRRPPPELPVFVVDSARMPNIAQHDRQAIADGHPQVLTRADPLTARKNRAAACGRFREPPLSCDEYPFAVTFQGGENASIRGVPLVEQLRQGGDLSNFFRKYSIGLGDPFLVVVG